MIEVRVRLCDDQAFVANCCEKATVRAGVAIGNFATVVIATGRLFPIGSRSVASSLPPSRENSRIAVLEVAREPMALGGKLPGT